MLIPAGYKLDDFETDQPLYEGDFLELLNEPTVQTPTSGVALRIQSPPSVSEILRKWVDEWLDSGRSNSGVEKPADRRFHREDNVSQVVFEYSNRNRIRLLGIGRKVTLWFKPYEEGSRPVRFVRPSNEDIAREKLVFFLLTSLRFKLAKCRRDECGKYFLLKHWNRTYKRGTLCLDHQRAQSLENAAKTTSKERKAAKEELVSLWAKRFGKEIRKYPDWSKNVRLKTAMAKYLNSQIKREKLLRTAYPEGITAKWVAHPKNRRAIEKVL